MRLLLAGTWYLCTINENERMLTARKQVSAKLFYLFVDPSPFKRTPITYHFFYDLNYTELSSCPVQAALSRGNFCQTIKTILSFSPGCSKASSLEQRLSKVSQRFPSIWYSTGIALSKHLVKQISGNDRRLVSIIDNEKWR